MAMDPYNPIIAAHAAAAQATGARTRRLMRLEFLGAWPWLALQLLALWPALAWSARRVADGSDDPLGLVALSLLAVSGVCGRLACRAEPRPAWLAAAMALTLAATVALGHVPPLAHALLAALALACAWAAFRTHRSPVLPVLGLLWLALPLLASLQFYAGFPLRAATAWLSAGLLQAAGVAAEAAGASVTIDGRLVLVDAPCSGVQLAWFAYCTACAAALWRGVPEGRFVRRLALVGLAALLGNVLRNTALLGAEAGVWSWPAWSHDAAGLVVLGAVCAVAAALMQPGPRDAQA
jgi:exosortase/archaeosortase family protein